MSALYVPLERREHGISGGSGGSSQVEDTLQQVQRALERALRADPNLALEAKGWLIDTLAALPDVPTDIAVACFAFDSAAAAAGGGRGSRDATPAAARPLPRGAERQLLRLACGARRRQLARLLAHSASFLRSFFARADAPAPARFFAGFSIAGAEKFAPGAAALANFALAHRERAWRHLAWAGRHPQAPVAVAAKPHYFCELDVSATVRALAADCPEFWTSAELARALEDGEWMELDLDYCCQELQERLHSGSRTWAADISAELAAAAAEAPWRQLCSQIAPLLGEGDLLEILDLVGQRQLGGRRGLERWAAGTGGGGGSGERSEGGSAALILAGVRWRDIRGALLANAVTLGAGGAGSGVSGAGSGGAPAAAGGPLLRLLRQDEAAAAEVAGVLRLAAQLHGGGEEGRRAQRAFLFGLDLSSSRQRLLLLLNAWTLRLHLQQAAGAAPEGAAAHAQRLLRQLGWRCEAVGGAEQQRQHHSGGGGSRRGRRRRSSSREGRGGGERGSNGSGSRRSRSRSRQRRRKRKKKGKHRKKRRRSHSSGSDSSARRGSSGSLLSYSGGGGAAAAGSGSESEGEGHREPGGRGGEAALLRAWLPGAGGCVEGAPAEVLAAAADWACREWVRALV